MRKLHSLWKYPLFFALLSLAGIAVLFALCFAIPAIRLGHSLSLEKDTV